MQQKIVIFCTFFVILFIVENVKSQTITDNRSIGSWVYTTGTMGYLVHIKPTLKFPPSSIIGKIYKDNWGDKIVMGKETKYLKPTQTH